MLKPLSQRILINPVGHLISIGLPIALKPSISLTVEDTCRWEGLSCGGQERGRDPLHSPSPRPLVLQGLTPWLTPASNYLGKLRRPPHRPAQLRPLHRHAQSQGHQRAERPLLDTGGRAIARDAPEIQLTGDLANG